MIHTCCNGDYDTHTWLWYTPVSYRNRTFNPKRLGPDIYPTNPMCKDSHLTHLGAMHARRHTLPKGRWHFHLLLSPGRSNLLVSDIHMGCALSIQTIEQTFHTHLNLTDIWNALYSYKPLSKCPNSPGSCLWLQTHTLHPSYHLHCPDCLHHLFLPCSELQDLQLSGWAEGAALS